MSDPDISIDERLTYYRKLVDNHHQAVLKGDTVPYPSLNGNMYRYLSKDGFLALRLGKDDRKAFLQKYNTTLVYGTVLFKKNM